MRKRKQTDHVKERIDGILIAELEIERDEDLTLNHNATLDSFPGFDEDWTQSYIVALLENEFDIEIPDEVIPELRTVEDVHKLAQSFLKG
jgi:acyl carrier protein